MENPHWLSSPDRTCASIDVNVMYPEAGDKEGEAIAKSVCVECTYQDLCLGWAIKMREVSGVWGGLTETERQTAKRKMRDNEQKRNRYGNRKP